jgi:uncharacterized protein (TIGR02996 family)
LPALEAAVIANAEDDTPRLVYADWLEENGDPNRAAFIRAQVALWDKNPADEDYVDLLEQRVETRIRAKPDRLTPVLPHSLEFRYPETDFRRGFPYIATVGYSDSQQAFQPEHLHALSEALPEVFRNTTIRGLRLGLDYTPHLREILTTPVANQITALKIASFRHSAISDLCQSDVLRQLKWLEISQEVETSDLDHLSIARFENLGRLDCQTICGSAIAVNRFFRSLAARRIRRLSLAINEESASALSELSQLKDLHTLELVAERHAEVSFLANGRHFPSLARLVLQRVEFGDDGANHLAAVTLPNLTALNIIGHQGRNSLDEDIATLACSPLFEHLTSLEASHGRITEVGIKAIASSPSSKSLRFLDVGTNAFGTVGLMTIAKPETFPNLTTLHVGTAGIESRRTRPEIVAQFLRAWSNSSIRHLDLNYWNLGDVGAKALAGNPAFGNLRWLSINYTGTLGRAGLRAIVESPHLRNLFHISLQGIPAEKSADLFLDPTSLPNLVECWLPFATNPMKKKLVDARPNVRWD